VRRCRRKKHARKEEEGDGDIIEGDWGTTDRRRKIIGSRYKTRR